MYKLLIDGTTVWAASYGGGLIKLNHETGDYVIFTSDSAESDTLSNDTVYSLYKDSTGIIWIGTNGGGLNRIIPGASRFSLMKHNNNDPDSLANGKINAIFEDSKSDIWVSVYNKGLDRYDHEAMKFVHYTQDPEDDSSLSNNLVNFIYEDNAQNLWIGTNVGLNLYNRKQDSFTRIYTDSEEPDGPGDTIITAMTEDHDNNLWIGTYNSGVTLYQREMGTNVHFTYDPENPGSLSDNLIRNILCDSNGKIWIGTNKGLNRYNPDTGTFISFYHDLEDRGSISSDNIYDLFEDSMGGFWIGTTGGGLNRFNPETETFSYYSREDGLIDNNILNILEDEDRNLWISTRLGLTIFSLENESFKIVTHANGFPSMEMSLGKTVTHNGEILFGTADGIVKIDPKLSIPDQSNANLILTEFRVMGEAFLGKTPPYSLEEVVLKYTDIFFDFEFAELQYLSPVSSGFAYMLEGFDHDWNYSENRNYGSYTSISHGNYTLRIRSIRQDGEWNENEISVKITVLPPFWLHPAAFVLYGLIVIGIVVFILFLIRKKRRNQLLALMKKEEENIRLEKEIEHRTTEIATEKERLAVTLGSIGDGVIAAGVDGTVQMMNRVAEKYTGWKQEEAFGRPIMDIYNLIDNSARIPRVNLVKKVLEGKDGAVSTQLSLLIARDGTKRIVSESDARIKNAAGETIGIVLVFRDMTEEQKMQIRLQRNDKLESLGVLAGGLAHDFNNLLSGLFGYVEMAKETSEQSEVVQYLDHALVAFNRAKALTQQLLTFSRGGTPMRKTLHLGDIVQKSVSFALSGSNVSSSITVAEDLWLCDADVNQIGQVIDNIIINAKQAMTEGGNIFITMQNERILDHSNKHPGLSGGDYIAIIIKDSGCGIPPEVLPKIFDPFFTTKTSGNGLGLATCYSIIEKHQGIIEVVSQADEGSIFSIYLPRSDNTLSEFKNAETAEHEGAGTFLVMDDEPAILQVSEKMLKMMGYEVLTASTGSEAVSLCRTARDSSVLLTGAILDLTIPGGAGGKEIISSLRAISPEMIIIATSGYSNDPIMADPETYGFTDSIRKPYRIKDLADILNKHIN